MPVFTKGERSLLFIHVPKTGGTTMERLLVGAGWEMSDYATARTESAVRSRLRRCSPQHYHAAILRQLYHVPAFDARFLIVRDPVARFRSEYSHRCRSPETAHHAAVSAWADTQLAKLGTQPYLSDNHLRPQHEFVVRAADVYRFEDGLDAIAADADARFDLGLELGPTIPHHRHRREGDVLSSDIEVAPELEGRLRDFYATDLAAFGYDGAPRPDARIPHHRLHRVG